MKVRPGTVPLSPLVVPADEVATVQFLDNLSGRLREELESGRPIVWAARFSGNGGLGARKSCILDARQGADDLARFGIEIRHLLPSDEVLDGYLKAAVPGRSKEASKDRHFYNRVVELWLTPQVLLVLSTGTGSCISEESLAQPFLAYLNATVVRVRPVLLFAKRCDRLGRRAWGLGASLDAMKSFPSAFVGDQKGIDALAQMAEMRIFLESSRAEEFAAGIPVQTRRGMASRTGAVMVNGQVPYGLASSPPPGFARVRLRGSGVGGSGQMLMCLEQPGCLPPGQRSPSDTPKSSTHLPVRSAIRSRSCAGRWTALPTPTGLSKQSAKA